MQLEASADAPEVMASPAGLAKTNRSAADRTHRDYRSDDEENDPDGAEEESR